MSDGAIFVAVIGGLAVARIMLATVIFLMLLPDGTACPHCDAPTFRVRSRGWNLLLPWFRTSWCPGCGWEGLLRHGPQRDPPRRTQLHRNSDIPPVRPSDTSTEIRT